MDWQLGQKYEYANSVINAINCEYQINGIVHLMIFSMLGDNGILG